MIQLTLTEVQFGVAPMPNLPGGKLLQFVDPKSGILVAVPLDEKSCQLMAAQLRSGILVAAADQMPHPVNGAVRG